MALTQESKQRDENINFKIHSTKTNQEFKSDNILWLRTHKETVYDGSFVPLKLPIFCFLNIFTHKCTTQRE